VNSNSANPRKVLGRGLESLLGPLPATDLAAAAGSTSPDGEGVRSIPVARIQPNPYQPRRTFSDPAMEEMAASIRASGVLQPILVRPLPQGDFQLVAGERRWRAAQRAGLSEIPALVRSLTDERALELAIVENLQREDLNPMDQARAFHQLATSFRLTQEEIAQRTGKDRATIANFLRLLKLEPDVQQMVEQGSLSMGHARALLALTGEPQVTVARRSAEQSWSVRQLERFISARSPKNSESSQPAIDPNVRAAQEELARALGAKIRIKDHNGSGLIEIAYHGLDDFQRIYERLVRSPES